MTTKPHASVHKPPERGLLSTSKTLKLNLRSHFIMYECMTNETFEFYRENNSFF